MKEQLFTAILPELPIVGTLKLTSRDGKSLTSIDVVKRHRPTELSPFFENCYQELKDFLAGSRRDFTIPLDMSELSDFQHKVLKVMRKIPYGEVKTYKELALKINSKGYQAIGSACGKNPFLLIYPCHRVVGSNDIGGFAHGLVMKQKLLLLEKSSL